MGAIASLGAWFGIKSFFGVPRWGIAAAIIALVVAGAITAITITDHTVHTTLKTVATTAKEAGAAQAVSAGQQTTLNQVGAAHAASDEIRSGASSAKFDECVRDSAPGYAGACNRYKPVEPVPGGRGDPGASGARRGR